MIRNVLPDTESNFLYSWKSKESYPLSAIVNRKQQKEIEKEEVYGWIYSFYQRERNWIVAPPTYIYLRK